MHKILRSWLLLFAALACLPLCVQAAPPAGFTMVSFVEELEEPTAMAFAPDGRLFICEQAGTLRVAKGGVLLDQPFIALEGVDGGGERGLLGVTFHPQFHTEPWVYVYYTVAGNTAHNRVSRFLADGDVADPNTPEQILLDLDSLSSAPNHNGGALHFGPDGNLYVAVGDNAAGSNAQSKNTLKGKILRMMPDGGVPPDNPFLGSTSGKNRLIWAMGLRNPFTFAFQPETGRMHINDVGQNQWEEVNLGAAGANYGWPTQEGPSGPNNPDFTRPLFAYNHSEPPFAGLAIAGGAFYNPPVPRFPASYLGRYFFADFLGAQGLGYIASFDSVDPAGTAAIFSPNMPFPVDLRVGQDGALYVLSRGFGTGRVLRIDYTVDQPPVIAVHPQDTMVTIGQPASFTVGASGAAPLAYQWTRNDVDIPGADGPGYTLDSPQPADSGDVFRVRVSNLFGTATSNPAVLSVVTNTPPTPTILTPAADAGYVGGQNFTYQGTAADAESGSLDAAAFSWRVDFHHDAHFHPFVPETAGSKSGSFTIPTEGETAANVWYRIHLTVTDPGGLSASTFIDLLPVTTTFTLQTAPPGLELTLDGQPFTAPQAVLGVAGMRRTLGAAPTQSSGGRTYQFEGWSDGGAATHPIATPTSPATFTATYVLASGGPSNLAVAVPSAIRAELTWTAALDPDGYRIERRTGTDPWQEIAQPGPGALGHTDATLEPLTAYTYRVRAVIDETSTLPTNEVEITTPAPGMLSVPGSLNFGKSKVGVTKTVSLTVKNKGKGPLPVTIGPAGAPFEIKAQSFTLSPREKRKLSVAFRPTSASSFAGTLTVQSDDPLKRTAAVALSGKGK